MAPAAGAVGAAPSSGARQPSPSSPRPWRAVSTRCRPTAAATAVRGLGDGDHTHRVRAAPVPAGFRLVREKALGATFPVPDGWKRVDKASSEQVTYTDPSGLVGLTIGTVNPAGANPESHFQNIEANTKLNFSTYRKLRMQRTTFQGKPAAVWEFTFQGQVRAFRAIDFGFGEEGGTEYDIYLSAPEAQWDKRRPVFDTVKAGFRVG